VPAQREHRALQSWRIIGEMAPLRNFILARYRLESGPRHCRAERASGSVPKNLFPRRWSSSLLVLMGDSGKAHYANSLNPGSLTMRSKSNLKLVTPDTVKRTVMPKRRPNAELRTRSI
jgi:hypothetical protein